MSSSLMSSSFVILSFLLLVRSARGVDPITYSCFTPENFTASSPYLVYLKYLLADLSGKTPQSGFWKESTGTTIDDRAYGLALCRGDVSPTECDACVANAASEIRRSCPDYKGAVIWYDNCMLKYSNNSFFGQIDEQNSFQMTSSKNASDPQDFDLQLRRLLGLLPEKARVDPKMCATGESDLIGGSTQKIYGLAQCTRDLSSVDCKKCLDDAASLLTSLYAGKNGGRLATGSCNVRFEIYPFTSA